MNMFRRAFFPRPAERDAAPHGSLVEQGGLPIIFLLRDLPAGCTGHVRALTGGHGVVARLAALGLTPGATVTVLQNPGHGPLILLVRDSRLVLGRGEAGHVTVVPVPEPGDEQGV